MTNKKEITWNELYRSHCVDFDDQGEQFADNIGLEGIFYAGYEARNAEVEELKADYLKVRTLDFESYEKLKDENNQLIKDKIDLVLKHAICERDFLGHKLDYAILQKENLKLKELVRDFSKVLYNGEFYPNFKDAELFESILNRIELVVNR